MDDPDKFLKSKSPKLCRRRSPSPIKKKTTKRGRKDQESKKTPEKDELGRSNSNSKWVMRRDGSGHTPDRLLSASKERPDSAAKWVTRKW